MRSAERISRTPSEWADRQRAERQRNLREALGMLRRARERGEEWYLWVANGRRPYTQAEYDALQAGRPRKRRRG